METRGHLDDAAAKEATIRHVEGAWNADLLTINGVVAIRKSPKLQALRQTRSLATWRLHKIYVGR